MSEFVARDGRVFASEQGLRFYQRALRQAMELERGFLGLSTSATSTRKVNEARSGAYRGTGYVTLADGKAYPWKAQRMLPAGYVQHPPVKVRKLRAILSGQLRLWGGVSGGFGHLVRRLCCIDTTGREYIPQHVSGKRHVVCYEIRR
jgi:hypothetical protein